MDGRLAALRISQRLMCCHTTWLTKHKYTDRNHDMNCCDQNSPSREVVN